MFDIAGSVPDRPAASNLSQVHNPLGHPHIDSSIDKCVRLKPS